MPEQVCPDIDVPKLVALVLNEAHRLIIKQLRNDVYNKCEEERIICYECQGPFCSHEPVCQDMGFCEDWGCSAALDRCFDGAYWLQRKCLELCDIRNPADAKNQTEYRCLQSIGCADADERCAPENTCPGISIPSLSLMRFDRKEQVTPVQGKKDKKAPHRLPSRRLCPSPHRLRE